MANVQFRGANTNPQDSGPVLQSDPAQKILRRSQQYIDGLKRVRDLEIRYKQAWLNDYNQGFEKSRSRQEQQDAERQRQASAIGEKYIANLQSQQRRAQSITGRSANIEGSDPKTDSWLNFVIGASETAASMFSEYKEEKDKMDFDQGVVKGLMFPQTYDGLAFTKLSANADIMSMSSSAYAAALQAGGADPELVESVRAANPRQLQGMKYAQATMAGKNAVPEFMRQVSQGQSDFVVAINDGTGNLQEIPLNRIDQSNSDQMSTAFYQWIGDYYRNLGFQDTNQQFLQEGLTYASNAWQGQSGQIRNKEIQNNNKNRLDGVRQKAFATKDPKDWSMVYYEYTTTGGKDDAGARIQLYQDMVDGGLTVTEAEIIGESLTFPDQPKPIGQRFEAEFQEHVINKIKDKEFEQVNSKVAEIERRDTELYLQTREGMLKDMEPDQDVDAKNEQLLKLSEQAEAAGYNRTAALYKQMISYTEDSINDDRVVKEITTQLEQGLPINEEYIQSLPISRKTKVSLLKKVMTDNPAAASQDKIDRFKAEYISELKKRINYVDSTKTAPGSLARASNQAISDFRYRYKQHMLINNDPEQAYEHAAALFAEELGDDIGKGTYAVSGIDADGLLDPSVGVIGEFANFGLPTTTESAISSNQVINKYIADHSAQSIGTVPFAPPGIVESVKTQINQGKVVTVPSIYNQLSSRLPGVPSYLLFEADMKAHGVELPKGTFDMQKETDKTVLESINPLYRAGAQKLLYYKNNPIRSDKVLTTSGRDSVYAISTPSHQQVKDIVGKRESPNMGYDAVNIGYAGSTPGGIRSITGKSFNEMTVGEVKQLGAQGTIFAAGFYQFIPETLVEAAKAAGVTDDMLFNQAVQDRLFFVHLDRYGIHGPWERWWIEQGGADLALTAEEKAIIEAFREAYDPSQPWRHPKNMRPELIPHMAK